MKRALLVLIALLAALAFLLVQPGCKVRDDVLTDPPDAAELAELGKLYGRWYWMQSSGGIGGWLTTPDIVGYTQVLEIRPGNRYVLYKDNVIIESGIFDLYKKKSYLFDDYYYFIEFSGRQCSFSCFIWQLDHEYLIIVEDAWDAYSHLYYNITLIVNGPAQQEPSTLYPH